MVEKVAKVRALRETFVEDLAGMYEAEEMQQEIPQQEPIEVQAEIEEQTENTKEIHEWTIKLYQVVVQEMQQ